MVKLKPYVPSQKIGNGGILSLSTYSVLGGAVVGGIFWCISLLIYVPLFFPLFMGLLGILLMGQAVRQGKVRNFGVASLFSLVAGLSMMGTLHYLDYLQFQRLATREINRSAPRSVTPRQRHQLIQRFLRQETGSDGIWGYLKLQAQEGVELEFRARGASSATPINLGTTGTWIYWIVELGIVTFICLLGGTEAVSNPFCERSQKWYDKAKRIGHVSAESAAAFVEHFEKGSLVAAGALAKPQPEVEPHVGLVVDVRHSPGVKEADRMLIIETISYDGKGRQHKRTVIKGMIAARDLRPFEEAIANVSEQPLKIPPIPKSAEPTSEKRAEPVVETPSAPAQELTDVRASDRFESHGLKKLQLKQISRQLLEYSQIEKAYLVRKVVGDSAEKSLYVLGIAVHQDLQSSDDEENGFLEKLAKELHIPGQFWIFSLNLKPEIADAVEKVDSAPFYRSPSYQRV